MSTIGQALKMLKESRGLSTSEVARAVNVTGATYSKIERDQREVSFIMMYRICRFFEISLYEFADILDPRELERSDLSTLRVLEKRKKNK